MSYRLTAHAESELDRRMIPRYLLDQLMEEPQQIVAAFGLRRIYQSLMQLEEGKEYLLRAVVDDQTVPPTVVTVYRTSKVGKYWRTI